MYILTPYVCALARTTYMAQVSVGCQKDAYFYIDIDVCILHIFTHPNK